MDKIAIENHMCLYLDHRKLIETLYKQHVEPDSNSYTLKTELFNFKQKNDAKSVKTLHPLQNKRKRKAETNNEECNKIKSLIQLFIQHFQIILKKTHEDLSDMPRVWEEAIEFPQFRGANSTKEFQTAQFGRGTFLIPPQCKFYNYNVDQMPQLLAELDKFDIISMDIPWQNKYIRRLKKVKQSLAYNMLDNEQLKNMPIQELIHSRSLVALWCTNAMQHRRALEDEFLPHWNLKLVHTLKWFKLNTKGSLISPPKSEGYKQPYELLYIACHSERSTGDLEQLKNVDFIASVPSIIHSHKPPIIEWLKCYLDDAQRFRGLEIFARYLQPQITSIGLEVLKLMDSRLYNKVT